MARYKDYNEEQHYFDLIDLEQELPSDNRARIIKEIIASIDISDFDANYNNDKAGARATHVRIMLGILLLGHVRNITSSRKITEHCQYDLEFKYILHGNKVPDASTIRIFRQRHVKPLCRIFSLTVHLGSSLGMTDFGSLSIDGTKIQAYASLYETKNRRKLSKSIKLLERRMEKTLKRLQESDTQQHKDEFEKRLRNIEKRQSILEDFQKLLEEEDDEETNVNRVDNDARLMKTSEGKSIIGYNAQAGVECGHYGMIVSAEISQDATDDHLLKKIADAAESEVGRKYDTILADSGYISYESMAEAERDRRNILGPDKLFEKDKISFGVPDNFSKSNFEYDSHEDCYCCPMGETLPLKRMMKNSTSELIFTYENQLACSACPKKSCCIGKKGKYRKISRDYREPLRERMRKRLNTNEGYLLYAKRSQTVEPVFGNIKKNRGVSQFYYRGFEKVRAEWRLICTGINLSKIIEYLQGTDWRESLNNAL